MLLFLQYKFAPDLIMLDAYETVESWITTKNLNPRKLFPAMMRYSSEPHAKYYCQLKSTYMFKFSSPTWFICMFVYHLYSQGLVPDCYLNTITLFKIRK